LRASKRYIKNQCYIKIFHKVFSEGRNYALKIEIRGKHDIVKALYIARDTSQSTRNTKESEKLPTPCIRDVPHVSRLLPRPLLLILVAATATATATTATTTSILPPLSVVTHHARNNYGGKNTWRDFPLFPKGRGALSNAKTRGPGEHSAIRVYELELKECNGWLRRREKGDVHQHNSCGFSYVREETLVACSC
jgi:hypothetical protein